LFHLPIPNIASTEYKRKKTGNLKMPGAKIASTRDNVSREQFHDLWSTIFVAFDKGKGTGNVKYLA
jgi:hypothetical protein